MTLSCGFHMSKSPSHCVNKLEWLAEHRWSSKPATSHFLPPWWTTPTRRWSRFHALEFSWPSDLFWPVECSKSIPRLVWKGPGSFCPCSGKPDTNLGSSFDYAETMRRCTKMLKWSRALLTVQPVPPRSAWPSSRLNLNTAEGVNLRNVKQQKHCLHLLTQNWKQ